MTESPPPEITEQQDIGPEPHSAAEHQGELGVEGEERVTTPATTKSEFERTVGIVKDIVQTFGIIAAGIFAIVKFGLIDEPTLERHLVVSVSLNWLQRPTFCIADADIDLKNMSKSQINVAEIRGSSWLIEEPSGTSDNVSHFDIRRIIADKAPVDTFSYRDGPLVHLYISLSR